MIAKELIAKIKKFKGPIFIATQNFNDIFWVQAVKSDLIARLEYSFCGDVETGFELDGQGYLDKDYNSEI